MRALMKRWLVMVLIIVGGVASTIHLVNQQTPMYSSQALVILSQSRTALEEERAPLQNNAQIDALVSSELRYLTSDNFLLSLARSENLVNHPEFGGPRADAPSLVSDPFIPPTVAESELLPELRSRMGVAREGASYVVSITFLAEDPVFAADLSNAAAELFAQSSLERGSNTARSLAQRVISELPRRRLDVQKAEAVLDEIMISDMEQQTDATASQTLEKLRALTKRQAALAATENSPVTSLGTLNAREAEIYAQKRALWQLYASERAGDPTFVLTDSRAAEAFQGVDLARSVYSRLLGRLVDLELEASLYVSTARVLAPALVPFKPSHPKKTVSVALSGILSTAFAVAAALFLEFFTGRMNKANHIPDLIRSENRFFFETMATKLKRGFFAENGRRDQKLGIERDRLFAGLQAINFDLNRPTGQVVNLVTAGVLPNLSVIGSALAANYIENDQDVALLDFGCKDHFQRSQLRRFLSAFRFRPARKVPKISRGTDKLSGADLYAFINPRRRGGTSLSNEQKRQLVEHISESYDAVIIISPYPAAHSENTAFAEQADINIIVSHFRITNVKPLNEVVAWLGSINARAAMFSVTLGRA